MRLTLRTLLAYLDDTLPPAETLEMSAKLAQSDAGREIVKRIKRLERRRSLAPLEPDSYAAAEDANAIGCYLDNVLPHDDLEGLEKIILESPVLLHEVATSHQILTVVLGEPARVPPSSYERMYGLVEAPVGSNRDHEPTLRPAGARDPGATEVHSDEDDDEFMLGLPRLTRAAWNRKRTIALMAVLVAGLSASLILAWPRHQPNRPGPAWQPPEPVAVAVVKEPAAPPKQPVVEPKPAPVGELGPMPREFVPAAALPDRVPVAPAKDDVGTTGKGVDGSAHFWTRPPDNRSWSRLQGDTPEVPTGQPLICLPGQKAAFKAANGLLVEALGSLPETAGLPFLETKFTSHAPVAPVALDLTLAVGRVYVTRPADAPAALVRVRVGEEVWDVELLDPETEIAFERTNMLPPGPGSAGKGGETPRTEAIVAVLKGRVKARLDEYRAPDEMAAPSQIRWDSKAGKPGPAEPIPEDRVSAWAKSTAPRKGLPAEVDAGLRGFAAKLRTERGPLAVALNQMVTNPSNPVERGVALWALQAADGVSTLHETLEGNDLGGRKLAGDCLSYWIAQDSGRAAIYDEYLMRSRELDAGTRATLIQLLRPPGPKTAADAGQVSKLIDLMANSESVAVRELASSKLEFLFPEAAKEVRLFDAAGGEPARTGSVNAWKAFLKRKKLG